MPNKEPYKMVKINPEIYKLMEPHTAKYHRKYGYWGSRDLESVKDFVETAIKERAAAKSKLSTRAKK